MTNTEKYRDIRGREVPREKMLDNQLVNRGGKSVMRTPYGYAIDKAGQRYAVLSVSAVSFFGRPSGTQNEPGHLSCHGF